MEKEGYISNELKIVAFKLKNENYGVPINQVLSIEKLQEFTRVPHTFDFVKGVMNLRGIIVPVIDLQKRFSIGEVLSESDARIIIVEAESITAGLLVDAAKEVISIDQDMIIDTPEIVGGPEVDYIHSVAKIGENDLLILLNLSKVLSLEEIEAIKAIEA
ncbi:chemotaxis protein CheW [Scopulibacillus cellulosilyticus]|uniref:Chemotaxis protein CheW n=1 Tax=Scopulibacillus cellulosilyticus TaxID=2665665 RepID=A0ABW2PW94_9BACL